MCVDRVRAASNTYQLWSGAADSDTVTVGETGTLRSLNLKMCSPQSLTLSRATTATTVHFFPRPDSGTDRWRHITAVVALPKTRSVCSGLNFAVAALGFRVHVDGHQSDRLAGLRRPPSFHPTELADDHLK